MLKALCSVIPWTDFQSFKIYLHYGDHKDLDTTEQLNGAEVRYRGGTSGDGRGRN